PARARRPARRDQPTFVRVLRPARVGEVARPESPERAVSDLGAGAPGAMVRLARSGRGLVAALDGRGRRVRPEARARWLSDESRLGYGSPRGSAVPGSKRPSRSPRLLGPELKEAA